MVIVESRFYGQGTWRQVALSLTVELAQTVADFTKATIGADQVRFVGSNTQDARLDVRA